MTLSVCHTTWQTLSESVDCLCRDCAHMHAHSARKAFSTRERSHSKPFWAPSCPIQGRI